MSTRDPGLFLSRSLVAAAFVLFVVSACGTGYATIQPATTGTPTGATSPNPSAPGGQPSTAASESAPPASGTRTAAGDVPDNAVFLTYRDQAKGFSIQYVEGWQVVPHGDGVLIHDKDSSETVAVVAAPADVATWVSGTDLPALQALSSFALIKQDTVKVGSVTLIHLAYHLLAPPDPVTGKQVPSTVDRYYVPGPTGLAVISLSTPDGVDNVDAFKQMVGSFTWN